MPFYQTPPQSSDNQNVATPQPGYTAAVQTIYPNAVLAETFGTYLQNYLQNQFQIIPNQVVLSNSVCSDDVDALMLTDNIGQWPTSLSTFLGPFFSGGLAGYPHTGVTGLAAWESHYYFGSSLLIFNAPHIGITQYGDVGYVYRKGQNSTLSSTCGAIAGANAWTISSSLAPTTGSFPNDYQQYTITNIVYPYKAGLATGSYAQQMVFSTNIVAASSSQWFIDNVPTTGYYNAIPPTDIYYCGGTFINTDYGYLGYVDINTFQKLPQGTSIWEDYTTSFLAGLNG
jgi:Limiting CO2-inducible proteins B/C beta carbonyic anhydrases